MSDIHIDAKLGPERAQRQGAGYIRRWLEGWRRLEAEYREAQRMERRRQREREVEAALADRSEAVGHMDRFFARVYDDPDAGKATSGK